MTDSLSGVGKIKVKAVRPVAGAPALAEKPMILITAPHIMAHLKRFIPLLEEFGCTVQVADVLERMEAEDLLKWAGQFDGTICGDDRYTNEVFAACAPRLKVVSKWGTGIDSIDTKCAGDHDGHGVTRVSSPAICLKLLMHGYILTDCLH